MRYLGFFTPQANPTGTFNIQITQGKVKFSNESCQNLVVTFANGDSDKVPAGYEYIFCVNQSGTTISYTVISSLNLPCIDAVDVTIFDPGEKIEGVYPSPLVRQTIVGNSLNLATSTTSIVNDGNVAGTQIIEAKVSGDVTSTVTLTNDAILVLGDAAHNGSLTVFGPTSLDNGAITTNGTGTATIVEVDTNTIKAPADGASVFSVTAGNTRVQSTANVSIQIPSGTTKWLFTGSDLSCIGGGGINFNVGRIKDINSVSGGGSGTFNHGLSGTPLVFIPMDNTSGSQTMGASSFTGTQVVVTAGAGHAWKAITYR